jgi:hypothetical protein
MALDLPFPVASDSSNSPQIPPTHLFDQAVAALVTSLSTPPFPIRNVNDPLLHTLCERYYSPIFGRSIEEYRNAVYYHYTQ